MAKTSAEGIADENRFLAIETLLNTIQVALNRAPTRAQMISLLQIRQADIDNLQTRVVTLESKVASLESRVAALES